MKVTETGRPEGVFSALAFVIADPARQQTPAIR